MDKENDVGHQRRANLIEQLTNLTSKSLMVCWGKQSFFVLWAEASSAWTVSNSL
jgi:hypothetical protein